MPFLLSLKRFTKIGKSFDNLPIIEKDGEKFVNLSEVFTKDEIIIDDICDDEMLNTLIISLQEITEEQNKEIQKLKYQLNHYHTELELCNKKYQLVWDNIHKE